MHTLIVDRMTVDARLPRADNALIDRLQRALQRWSDASRLGADDNLVARVLPALTLDLGRLDEDRLLDELGPRLDRALAERWRASCRRLSKAAAAKSWRAGCGTARRCGPSPR